MAGARRSSAIGVWWVLVGALTLSSTVSSTITAGVLAVLGVVLLPVVVMRGAFADLARDCFVLLFCLAVALLAVVFAIDARAPADMIFVLNFAPLLLAVPVYVVARRISGPETVRTVVVLCFLGCIVALVIGSYTVFVRHLPRADGLFLTGSLIYARLAVLFGFIAAAGCLIPGPRWRYVYLLGPVIATAVCVLAGARGVLLCVPFLMLLLFVFVLRERSGRERWWIVGGIAALSIVGAAAALPFIDMARMLAIPGDVVNVMTGNGDATDMSTQRRLDFYWAGWTLFQRAPLLGYGWAHLRDAAFTVLDPQTNADFFSYHNDVLNFAVAGGVIGILALVIMLIAPLAGALTSPRDSLFTARLYGASAIVLLYALSGLTDHVIGYDMPTFAFAMMSAIVLGVFRDRAAETGSA